MNWKAKLTSRKFWAAITGFITAILIALKIDNLTIEQVVSVVTAGSVLIAYIVSEGLVDSAQIKANTSKDGDING